MTTGADSSQKNGLKPNYFDAKNFYFSYTLLQQHKYLFVVGRNSLDNEFHVPHLNFSMYSLGNHVCT